MKKIFFILISVNVLFFILPHYVDAHVLERDGSIGAVIHIDPDDDPIIGEESTINFEFKDTNNEFSLSGCSCFVSIKSKGIILAKEQLLPLKDVSSHMTYVFPEKGVYTIHIEGTPSQGNSFKSFSFNYDIRVTREVTAKQPSNILNVASGVASVFLLLFVGLFYIYKNTRTKGGDKK